MDNQFEAMDNDEVLYVSLGRVLMANPTFKVGEFLDALAQAVSDREDWSDDKEGWFSDGLECQALRFQRQGWQKGRVRIRLEFCPEEPRPNRLLDGRRDREPRRLERLEPTRSDSPYGNSESASRYDPYANLEDNY